MPYDKDGKYYRKAVVPKKKATSANKGLKEANKKFNFLAILIFVGFIGGCVATIHNANKPKRNPNLEGTVQDFDLCVKQQKAKGLSTDKCWDML